jgi:predicted dinucleotide-binding enzyme
MEKNIGIIGSGDVALTLGKLLIKKGYSVTIGSRNPTNEKVIHSAHHVYFNLHLVRS